MSKSHEQEHKHYANIKIGKPKNSEIDIEAEIPVETIEAHRKRILEETRKDFELPGFRKGKVPENLFLQSVNEMRVLQEAAEIAIEEAYPEIIHHEKIDVFGRPQITITKLAPKNPVGFKIHVAVIPPVRLPDYKKIGKNIVSAKSEIKISDEEIASVIKNIQRMQAGKKEAATNDNPPADTEDIATPELTDELVKTWGDFKDVADFRAKLSQSIKQEKEVEESRKTREEIIVKILDESKIDLPAVVVEDEANEIRGRLLEELKKSNLSFEDYLKRSNKTSEKYAEEERAFIERDLKNRLIIEEIAKIENIQIDEKEIEQNTEYMLRRHGGSDPIRMRHYVHNMLVNEKVFQLLEGRTIAR